MLVFVFIFPWSSHRDAIQKGIQGSSDWDGVGHRYVLSLPANQSHEECFAAARRVSHFTTLCTEGLHFSWCFAIVFDLKSTSPDALTFFDVHINSFSDVEFWMISLRSGLAPPYTHISILCWWTKACKGHIVGISLPGDFPLHIRLTSRTQSSWVTSTAWVWLKVIISAEQELHIALLQIVSVATSARGLLHNQRTDEDNLRSTEGKARREQMEQYREGLFFFPVCHWEL